MRRVAVQNVSRSGADLGRAIGIADTFWTRLRGLLGAPPLRPGEGLLLEGCQAVHMYGMKQALDVAFLGGEGEVVGGIVVMRFGENAQQTIDAVKARLAELEKSLPEGVEIVTTYDRSDLIERSVDTLKSTLIKEFIVVALVCALFLFHLRSSAVIVLSLPLGVLVAFIVMRAQGINANIMSLGGIAIAIGTMVDAAIVMIENAHKHLERYEAEHGEREGDVVAEPDLGTQCARHAGVLTSPPSVL